MRVGIAQMVCVPGDAAANAASYGRFARQASAEGCDLLLFPELSDTGYDLSVFPGCASAWDGRPMRTLQELAARHHLAIIAGLSEREGDAVYNSLALISKAGELQASYRKLHLFQDECAVFTRGSTPVTVAMGEFTLGLTICYDLRFPELYRRLALMGADVFINCAAWPSRRGAHWQILAQARAVENQAYFLGCNRVGVDAGLPMAGTSCLAAPSGQANVLSADGEGLAVGDIARAAIDEMRAAVPVYCDRRPEVYGLG